MSSSPSRLSTSVKCLFDVFWWYWVYPSQAGDVGEKKASLLSTVVQVFIFHTETFGTNLVNNREIMKEGSYLQFRRTVLIHLQVRKIQGQEDWKIRDDWQGPQWSKTSIKRIWTRSMAKRKKNMSVDSGIMKQVDSTTLDSPLTGVRPKTSCLWENK